MDCCRTKCCLHEFFNTEVDIGRSVKLRSNPFSLAEKFLVTIKEERVWEWDQHAV